MNAQKELLEHVKDREVEFVKVAYRKGYGCEPLRVEGALDEVLPLLNFEYDSGYRGQELFGYIWYSDGTWSERGEYDWQHKKVPDKGSNIET